MSDKFMSHDYQNEYPQIEVSFERDMDNELIYSYKIKEHYSYIRRDEPYAKWYHRILVIHEDTGFKSASEAFEKAIHWAEEIRDHAHTD